MGSRFALLDGRRMGEPLSASPRSQRPLCVPPADKPTLKISFVLPNKKPEPPPIDVTPQQPADYSKPALPPPREQKIDKEKGNVDRVQTSVGNGRGTPATADGEAL
jgi:hypothetical protein